MRNPVLSSGCNSLKKYMHVLLTYKVHTWTLTAKFSPAGKQHLVLCWLQWGWTHLLQRCLWLLKGHKKTGNCRRKVGDRWGSCWSYRHWIQSSIQTHTAQQQCMRAKIMGYNNSDCCLRWQKDLKRKKKKSGSFSQSTVRSAGAEFNRTTAVWDQRE